MNNPNTAFPSSPNTLVTSRTLLAVHLLIGLSVFIFCGISVTYSLALTSGHVKSFVCFISYTGNFPPESCIFSLVISSSSFIYCFIVYLRFTQISHAIDRENLPEKTAKKMNVCNLISVAFGLLGAFGLGMTGCFQHRAFHCLHLGGVVLCSYSTYVFFSLQTFFSFRLESLGTTTFIKIFRLLGVLLSGVLLLTASGLSLYFWITSRSNFRLMIEYIPRNDRQELRKIVVVIEWVFFLMYQILLYSLYNDLKKIAILRDRIVFLD